MTHTDIVEQISHILDTRPEDQHFVVDRDTMQNIRRLLFGAMKDAEAMICFRTCCGFVENGTDEIVTIFQDDATREWVLRVGQDNPTLQTKARFYHATTFRDVIKFAYTFEKGRV